MACVTPSDSFSEKFNAHRDTALRCQITHCVAKKPILATDGHTYDELAFDSWLATSGPKSPVTGRLLAPHPQTIEASSLLKRYAQRNHYLSDLSTLPSLCPKDSLESQSFCPITWEILHDPVQITGHVTMERDAAIKIWKNNQRRPDGLKFPEASLLVPNLAARQFLRDVLDISVAPSCPLQLLSIKSPHTQLVRWVEFAEDLAEFGSSHPIRILLVNCVLTLGLTTAAPFESTTWVLIQIALGMTELLTAAALAIENGRIDGQQDVRPALFSCMLQVLAIYGVFESGLPPSEPIGAFFLLTASCSATTGILLALQLIAQQGKSMVSAEGRKSVTELEEALTDF